MFNYLAISNLNDYVFCPYSIYLHNVYKGGDEDLYHATPQTRGKNAHKSVDEPKNIKSNVLTGLEVYSQELGLMGKIDVYRPETKSLVERKNMLKQIYQGQIWQLQAQYFCMIEMGFEIDSISFYSIQDNKTFALPLPTEEDKNILQNTIQKIKNVENLEDITINPNKCRNCIYNTLCDKTDINNVY